MLKKWFSNIDKVLFLWVAAIVINIITFLLLQYKIKPSGQTVALHYNVLVGVDLYGKGTSLYSIPIVGVLLTLVNASMYRGLKNRQPFLSFLAPIVTLFIQLILLLAVLFLIRVN